MTAIKAAQPWSQGTCLLEVHSGPAEGQVFLLCGPCVTRGRVDQADGGALMALARHLAYSHPRAEASDD